MGNLNYIDNIVESKLLSLHTCYLAKILSTDGSTAKIQPLGKIKEYGSDAKAQSPLTNVPIANSAKYKYTKETITYVTDANLNTSYGSFATDVSGGNESDAYVSSYDSALTSADITTQKDSKDIVTVKSIAAGDIVICVCCERNITDAKKGVNSTPPVGHHSMSDSIIVGIL